MTVSQATRKPDLDQFSVMLMYIMCAAYGKKDIIATIRHVAIPRLLGIGIDGFDEYWCIGSIGIDGTESIGGIGIGGTESIGGIGIGGTESIGGIGIDSFGTIRD
jgi:hypothetical protein